MVRGIEEVEPVQRHASQHLSLVRDRVVEDHVEGGDAVAGDDQEVSVVEAEDLAHLPRIDVNQRRHAGDGSPGAGGSEFP